VPAFAQAQGDTRAELERRCGGLPLAADTERGERLVECLSRIV
jgi:hypothetical protein